MEFDHLNDGEFEELTYELMEALGFKNVSWRRGTGRRGATADQGRDVVGDLIQTSVDGSVHTEHWFVQCKHYKSGVPPQKLNDALAWATAERPDVLLIAVSNALSNPAKAFLDQYRQNNRPTFRVKVWENKDFERLLTSRPALLRKFKLQPIDPFLDAHVLHTLFLMEPSSNTLEQLFAVLEEAPPKLRDTAMSFTRGNVINPRTRAAVTGDETLSELLVDGIDHRAFRKKCFELRQHTLEYFLVRSIVVDALTHLWHLCNPQRAESRTKSNSNAIEFFRQKLTEVTDARDEKALRGCIAMAQEAIDEAEPRQQSNYKTYCDFCETVVLKLILDQHEPQLPEVP